MQNYKDLKVWQKSHQFTLRIYKEVVSFPKEENYALTSQLKRAAYSIPSNIAEGCGRSTNADFARFLNISLGSANEVEYFVLLALDLGYLKRDSSTELDKEINEIKAMLISLIQKVRT